MKEQIEAFVKALNEKFPKVEQWDNRYYYSTGGKYYKIYTSPDGVAKSAYGFVDRETGDLYKAATWAAPAKHVRGNINDISGLDACEKYSVKYLR